MMLCSSVSAILFLSTPSARRATRQGIITHLHKHDFYPRPPRGGRRRLFRLVSQRDTISIHALREEGDSLSTAKVLWISISIHALREEGDHGPVSFSPMNRLFLSTPSARRATLALPDLRRQGNNFYPRPPRGGRPKFGEKTGEFIEFLSTPSARRATLADYLGLPTKVISIHALREEGDATTRQKKTQQPISIHALREEGDLHGWSRVTPK